MPTLICQWKTKWGHLHPGWSMKTWCEIPEQMNTLSCGNDVMNSSFPSLLQRCCHLSQRSNIWRYEIIEHWGGLYLDTDFEPIRNIEPLIESRKAFAGLAHTFYPMPKGTQIEAACALIGCTPHHPWTKDLVANIKTRDPSVSLSLGVNYFNEITSRHPEVNLFEPEVFYSHRYDVPSQYKPPVPSSAYAVHHWSSKWWPDSFKPVKQS